jgi:predicted DNA-binding protein (MmcQ/YjbR family)
MNVDFIRRFCLSLPETTESLQWGETLCFKVRGKLFVLLSLDAVPPTVCFKTTPERFAELLECEGIVVAPYIGRYKWVLLERLDVLPRQELEELIQQSYKMVVAKAPRKQKKGPKGSAKKRPGQRRHSRR